MNRLATATIAALLLGSSVVLAASSNPGNDGGGAPATGPISRPAVSPDALDLNIMNGVDARGRIWAQAQACQKAGESCDDQHTCCRGMVCVSVLSSRTKICDVRP
jgi:hypothetical protein